MTEPVERTEYYTRMSQGMTFDIPERSNYTCTLIEGVTYTPKKGKEPNWFHRWMQEFCFGVKWRKDD